MKLENRRPRRKRTLRSALLKLLLLALVAVFIAALFSTDHFRSFGGPADAVTLARMRLSPHFDGKKFENTEPQLRPSPGLVWSTLREWLFGKEMRVPICPLPAFPGAAAILKTPPASGLRITWMGHSTTLIEIDGAAILTDAQWSERASPSTLLGPERFHPPPIPLEALPHLDAVILSHDHYDHLDMETVRALAVRGVVFHVPLGLAGHLSAWGIPHTQIFEHDWWESARVAGVDLISTPSRHFSGRGVPWRTGTHWTSWAMVGPKHRVFFSGDTGPTDAFREIASREGPFDVAMIEIGQWHTSWGDIHLGPVGALDAFAMLDARLFFPIHWSTFELALHDWSEPAETLYTEAAKRGVPVTTPLLGQPVEPSANPPHTPWWRAYPPTAPRCP